MCAESRQPLTAILQRGPCINRLPNLPIAAYSTRAFGAPSSVDATAEVDNPAQWDAGQVKQLFFMEHNGGQWKEYADKFKGLTGEDLTALTEEDFLRRAPDNGDVIYNDWQALVARWVPQMEHHWMEFAGKVDSTPWEPDLEATQHIQQLLHMEPRKVEFGCDGDYLEVFQMDTPLQSDDYATSSALVVLPNMRLMWECFSNRSADVPVGKDQRWVVVGSPGLGKSRSIPYAIRLMIQRRRELVKDGVPMPVVVFEHRNDKLTWVFAPVDADAKDTEYQAWSVPRSKWAADVMPAVRNQHNILVVDASQPPGHGGEMPGLFAATTVYVCSPDPRHYSEFAKHKGEGTFIYGGPGCAEALVAAAKYMAPDRGLSDAEVRRRIEVVGPFPRRVFATPAGYTAFKKAIDSAMSQHPEEVKAVLLGGPFRFDSSPYEMLKPLSAVFMFVVENNIRRVRFVSNYARSHVGLTLTRVVFTALLANTKPDVESEELWETMEFMAFRLVHSGAWSARIEPHAGDGSDVEGESVSIKTKPGTGPVTMRTPPWDAVYAELKTLELWDGPHADGKAEEALGPAIILGGNFSVVDLMDGRNRGYQVTNVRKKRFKQSTVDNLRKKLGLTATQTLHIIITHLPGRRPEVALPRGGLYGAKVYFTSVPAPYGEGEEVWKAALEGV